MVARNARFDVSTAERHGKVVYLFENGPRPSALDPQGLHDGILERLEQMRYDPAVDCIAIAGGSIHVAILVAAVLGEYGGMHLLLFDAATEAYIHKELEASYVEA